MNLTVRRARLDDVPFLVESNLQMAMETEGLALERQTLDRGVRAVLSDASKGFYLVGEIEGAPAGQLLVTFEWSDWRNGCIWWVQSVYVAEQFRRRGVFKAIYHEAERLAREAGAVGLRLYVEKDNAIAQSTYQSLGMTRTHYLVMEAIWRRGKT